MLKKIDSSFLSTLVVFFVFFALGCVFVFLGRDETQVSLGVFGCAGTMSACALGNSQWRSNQLERRINELESQLMVERKEAG